MFAVKEHIKKDFSHRHTLNFNFAYAKHESVAYFSAQSSKINALSTQRCLQRF